MPNETIEILSIIYRDYIVDPEERKKLIAEEQAEERNMKREADKERIKEQNTNNAKNTREIDEIMKKYEEILSLRRPLDMDVLKAVYERGKTILAQAHLKENSITKK